MEVWEIRCEYVKWGKVAKKRESGVVNKDKIIVTLCERVCLVAKSARWSCTTIWNKTKKINAPWNFATKFISFVRQIRVIWWSGPCHFPPIDALEKNYDGPFHTFQLDKAYELGWYCVQCSLVIQLYPYYILHPSMRRSKTKSVHSRYRANGRV